MLQFSIIMPLYNKAPYVRKAVETGGKRRLSFYDYRFMIIIL